MFLRILWTSLFAILMIMPLHADWKKATIGEKFAGKRVVDNELEENDVEPVEGNTNLYAKARIMVELDNGEILQSYGTEFKAIGRVRGIEPNNDYEGYWYVDLTAWHGHRRVPHTGYTKWFSDVTKEFDKKWKWTGSPKHLTPPADHLSRCTASAFIDGGDNHHYWNDEYYYQPPPYTPDVAYAYAYDFSYEDRDAWDCYRCTTNDDPWLTPCSKCGGNDDFPPGDNLPSPNLGINPTDPNPTTTSSVTSTNTGSSSYGCDYNAEYDYCTDTGTCTTRTGSDGIGMCGHRWCCCAPETTTQTPEFVDNTPDCSYCTDGCSACPTTTTTVISTNTGYSSSYGCDYNAEYDYCTDTGWCSERSGEFGIGMCGHRWCCCAPE